MGEVSLEKIHEDIVGLKKDVEHIKTLIEEDYAVAEDVVGEIKKSRKRPDSEFVSHEELKKEFS
jgi:hypothetical protein